MARKTFTMQKSSAIFYFEALVKQTCKLGNLGMCVFISSNNFVLKKLTPNISEIMVAIILPYEYIATSLYMANRVRGRNHKYTRVDWTGKFRDDSMYHPLRQTFVFSSAT